MQRSLLTLLGIVSLLIIGCSSNYATRDLLLPNSKLSDEQKQKIEILQRQIERHEREIEDIKRQQYHNDRYRPYEIR